MTDICDHPLDNAYADALRRNGVPCETREEFVEFLAKMMETFDEVQSRMKADGMSTVQLREYVYPRLRAGESIIQCAKDLGMILPDLVRKLSGNQQTVMELWPPDRWREVEEVVQNPPEGGWGTTGYAFKERLGLTLGSCRALMRWYHG